MLMPYPLESLDGVRKFDLMSFLGHPTTCIITKVQYKINI